MKLMRQDLKKTEESGEWEVKVRRGNQQPAHKSRTLPLSSWDFINHCSKIEQKFLLFQSKSQSP